MIAAVLLDLFILFAISVFGALIVYVVLSPSNTLAYLSLAFPLGGGVLTWLIFSLGWMGLNIFPTTSIIAYLIGTTTLILIGLKIGRFRKESIPCWRSLRKNLSDRNVKYFLTPTIFIGILILAIVIAVGRSYSTWDAMAIWSMRGYGISIDNSIFAPGTWGSGSLTYPLNLSLLIAHFHFLDGDVLPGSKMIFPLLFACAVMGAYHFWRAHGIREKFANYSQVIFWTVPLMFFHATIGYANLPTASYLTLGFLWGVEGVFKDNRKAQLVSGFLLGLASWTRVEASMYSVVAYLAIIMARWLAKRGKIYPFSWVSPFLAITIIWLLFFRLYGFTGTAIESAVQKSSLGITSGWFNLPAIGVILNNFWRQILDLSRWGLVYPLVIIGLVVGWKNLRPRINPETFALFGGIIAYAASTALVFYVASYNSYPDHSENFVSWLSRSFSRQIMPITMMAVVLLPFLFRNLFKDHNSDLSFPDEKDVN